MEKVYDNFVQNLIVNSHIEKYGSGGLLEYGGLTKRNCHSE